MYWKHTLEVYNLFPERHKKRIKAQFNILFFTMNFFKIKLSVSSCSKNTNDELHLLFFFFFLSILSFFSLLCLHAINNKRIWKMMPRMFNATVTVYEKWIFGKRSVDKQNSLCSLGICIEFKLFLFIFFLYCLFIFVVLIYRYCIT